MNNREQGSGNRGQGAKRRLGRVLLLAAIPAAMAGAWWTLSLLPALGGALRQPAFVRWGLMLLGCVVALEVLLPAAAALGRRGRRRVLPADQRGTAVMEFALVFPVLAAIVLTMWQLMIMMRALVVVHYAAFAAARTAIVWAPQDLAGDVQGGLDAEPENCVAEPERSLKMQMIRRAAAVACMPISGETRTAAAGAADVAEGVSSYYSENGQRQPAWVRSLVAKQFSYAWNNTTARLDNWPGAAVPLAAHAPIVVRVQHDLQLNVPFARALFYDGRNADGFYSRVTAVQTLINEGVTERIEEDPFDTGS